MISIDRYQMEIFFRRLKLMLLMSKRLRERKKKEFSPLSSLVDLTISFYFDFCDVAVVDSTKSCRVNFESNLVSPSPRINRSHYSIITWIMPLFFNFVLIFCYFHSGPYSEGLYWWRQKPGGEYVQRYGGRKGDVLQGVYKQLASINIVLSFLICLFFTK